MQIMSLVGPMVVVTKVYVLDSIYTSYSNEVTV